MSQHTARGRNIGLQLAYQTDLKTKAATDASAVALTAYSIGLSRQAALPQDPELGRALDNPRDDTAPAAPLPTVSGSIVAPADLATLGHWLKLALGAPTSTDETTHHEHVFTSGLLDLPFGTLEASVHNTATYKLIELAHGLHVNGFTIDLEKAEGFGRVTLDCIARDLENLSAVYYTSPGSLPTAAKVPQRNVSVLIDDVAVGTALRGSIAYSNHSEPQNFLDGADFISSILPGMGTLSLDLSLRLDNRAILDKLTDHTTPVKIEVLQQISATASVSYVCETAYAPRVAPTIEGPGGITFDARFTGAQKDGGSPKPLLAVTLKNAVTAY